MIYYMCLLALQMQVVRVHKFHIIFHQIVIVNMVFFAIVIMFNHFTCLYFVSKTRLGLGIGLRLTS
jgi:hypothetical protein